MSHSDPVAQGCDYPAMTKKHILGRFLPIHQGGSGAYIQVLEGYPAASLLPNAAATMDSQHFSPPTRMNINHLSVHFSNLEPVEVEDIELTTRSATAIPVSEHGGRRGENCG